MTKKQLDRKIIQTEDGSQTLYIPGLDENYHSTHGAIQESKHVFIKAGLEQCTDKKTVNILEIGFGTGLNAILTQQYAEKNQIEIFFQTIEKYPLTSKEYNILNYPEILGSDTKEAFIKMHTQAWENPIKTSNFFTLQKHQADLEFADFKPCFDLIFFDAFAPTIQPNLWTTKIFIKMYYALIKNGLLVTYSAKGQVRRNMIEAGFKVERLAGPPGKREMLRAFKY